MLAIRLVHRFTGHIVAMMHIAELRGVTIPKMHRELWSMKSGAGLRHKTAS